MDLTETMGTAIRTRVFLALEEQPRVAILATGVDNWTCDNLKIDTNRDGIDIDCCQNVRISNCTVNSPWDDAICPKSSYALGVPRVTENVTISNCLVTGNYQVGSLLDGSWKKMPPEFAKDIHGRIKFGTETNGGFRNVRISDCICTNTRGILMGIVDGGTLEDVSVSGIILRDPVNHPLFVHHGARMRAPRGTPIGRIRGVQFEDVTVSGAHPRFPCGVEGIADAPVEDVTFRNIHITAQGGGTREDAARVPEYRRETSLEVSYLGTLPAAGFYARHARRLTIRDVSLRTAAADARPVVALRNVDGAIVDRVASAIPRDAVLDSRDSRNVALGEVTRWGN